MNRQPKKKRKKGSLLFRITRKIYDCSLEIRCQKIHKIQENFPAIPLIPERAEGRIGRNRQKYFSNYCEVFLFGPSLRTTKLVKILVGPAELLLTSTRKGWKVQQRITLYKQMCYLCEPKLENLLNSNVEIIKNIQGTVF